MLNHKFTGREAAFILVLVAVILGYFYYYVVYQNIENEIAKYDTTDIEDQIESEQMRTNNLLKMKAELENEGDSASVLGVYNNQSEELLALADILEGKATAITMNWSDPQLSGGIVRRDVTITFNTGSIEEAGELIKQISDCKYTLLIVDVSMNETKVTSEVEVESVVPAPTVDVTLEGENDTVSDDVSVDDNTEETVAPQTNTEKVMVTNKVTTVIITIRFFETTDGAVNLNGLDIPAPAPILDDDDSELPSTAELNEDING